MTTFLLGALVAFAMCTAMECYLLLGVVQRLRTTFEQLLAAAQQLLAAVPGKSAERTDGPTHVETVEWFPRLKLLAGLRTLLTELRAIPGVGPATTVKDALTNDPAPDDDPNERTAEMTLGDEIAADAHAHHVRATQLQPAEPDDVDLVLRRFTFAGGHRATDGSTTDSEGDD